MNRILLFLFLSLSTVVYAQRINPPAVAVQVPGLGYQFLHAQTQLPVNNLIWDEAESFVNGYARVLSSNKFSFVDITGKPICAAQFEEARNFVNSLAAVKKDSKWGFINEEGKVVIPFQYEIVYDFKEQVTAVFTNHKWSLINIKGAIIKPLDISVFYGFNNGNANIIKDGQTGTMNTRGDIRLNGQIAQPVTQRPNLSANNVVSQCPDNIDFENGSFNNWKCFTGRVDSVGNTNVVTVTPSAPIANRHRIFNRTMPSAIDAFGLFPLNPPDGSNFAVKLGNTKIGAEAERIQYKIRVPVNDSNFSIKYDYAVVFQDPGHTAWTQPRFTAKLFDSSTNAYIDCASFEYISTSTLPGFARSTVDTSVIYKPWATVFISLRGHAGKTLFLEFTTADCVRRGHWGYAYVDVESTCGHSIEMQYDCNRGTATLDAPPGFETYNWWNQNYTTLLGTGQHITLNPAPRINSTIWLEMIPFNDFGCRDSMPVKVTGTFTPHFDASDTLVVCAPHLFTFYNRDLPSSSAIWDFGDGSTGTGDTVTHTYLLPGTYVVTLNTTLPSGCNGVSQQTVRIVQPTGSFTYSGGNFCNSRQVSFNATTSNIDSLVWDFGDGTIIHTNQTSITHTYSTSGIYTPNLTLISNSGCHIFLQGTDSIKIEILIAGFTNTERKICGSTTLNFSDTSSSFFGITRSDWNFGDGITGTGNTISHTYTTAGTYNVQLIITGQTGCKDTIIKPIIVSINDIPTASITGPVAECSLVPVTFTGTVQSIDPIGSLQWISSDGINGSGNTFTNSFTQPGDYTIQLITGTVNGCFDTTTHQITIKPIPDVVQPNSIESCNGSTTSPILFTGAVSGTTYTWINDLPAIGLAANGTGDIPSFNTINNTGAVIIANITVTPTANSCPGVAKTFTITIYPTPVIPQLTDQTVCNRDVTTGVTFTSFTNAITSATYNWTNDLPSIGLPANGSGNIPEFTAINNTSAPITATITVSVSNNGCPGTPQRFTITVNPTPDVNQPANKVLCNGSTSGSIPFNGSVSGTTFSWTNDQPSIGLAASGSDSISIFTGINNTAIPIIATIEITPLALGCPGVPETLTITINPTPNVDQPVNQSLCNGNSTTNIGFTGIVNSTIYNWTNDLPSIGLMAAGSGDISTFTPINNSSTNITATVTVTPVANSCPGSPKDFTITVFPTPNMIQPLNQFQCNGETTPDMAFTGSVAGTSFSWTNNMPSIGLAASGSGTIPSFTTINNTNTAVTATITVTASTNNCPGISKTFNITVDPTPDMIQPLNQTVCNGALISDIQFIGTVNGTSYSWINTSTAIGLAANGSGNIPSFIATNNTHFPITAIISVTGTANSCGSAIKVFTITVNPSPDVDQPDNVAVCNGIVTSPVVLSGPVSGITYSWKNNNTSIGLAAIGTGNIPSFIAINNTAVPVIATIRVTGTGNACTGTEKIFTITVNPSPDINANNNTNVCLGSSAQLVASGAAQYTWSPAVGLSCTTCPNPVATPTDSIMYSVKGTSSLGCIGYDSVLLQVIKPFDMLVPPGDTVCIGGSRNLKAMNANSYLWSPPDGLNRTDLAEPTATPLVSTRYRVVGYDAYHCFTDTGYVTIAVGPKPTVNIGADLTSTTGTPVTFHPTTQNGPIVSWTWTPSTDLSCSDCPDPTTTIRNNMAYMLTVVNSFGCIATDTLMVNALCKKAQVFVPNAFTPDGDGLNDILMIRGTGITVKSFRVFNRWGVLVFEKLNFSPNDPKYGWDGKIRGVPATPDVYVYTAEVFCDNAVAYTYKGNTTILK